jgi:Bacterial CdiA-CT RNAse A domain
MPRWKLRLAICTASLVLVLASACGKVTFYSVDASNAPKPATSVASREASRRDLALDESSGGHTLARHVGRSDAELRDRLANEQVSAASTYTDRATAEQAVTAAIAGSQPRMQSWLGRSGRRTNLVLDYDSPTPLGRSLRSGEASPLPCSHAVVVLKWKAPAGYYVLTSYPECR